MIKVNGDDFIFSSGRQLYANRGIVGINQNLELSEGYDGSIEWPIPEWWKTEHQDWITERTLSKEDMTELADYMLGLWTKFKESLK